MDFWFLSHSVTHRWNTLIAKCALAASRSISYHRATDPNPGGLGWNCLLCCFCSCCSVNLNWTSLSFKLIFPLNWDHYKSLECNKSLSWAQWDFEVATEQNEVLQTFADCALQRHPNTKETSEQKLLRQISEHFSKFHDHSQKNRQNEPH